VLGRTLDELPPQTRKLLNHITDMVNEFCDNHAIKQNEYRFTRKDVREFTGWGNTQLKIHLKRLEEMEYLIVHRGKRGQTFEYELIYDGVFNDKLHLMGLIDVKKIQCDEKKSGLNKSKSPLGRDEVGGQSVGGRNGKSSAIPLVASDLKISHELDEKSTTYKNNEPAHHSGVAHA
jgi:DNA primase